MTTLKEQDVDGVPVLCEECGTVTTKGDVGHAKAVRDHHNEKRHGNKKVAVVVEEEYDVDTEKIPTGQKKDFMRRIVDLVE